MSMASGADDAKGLDMSSPAIQVMSAMGEARNALLKLSSLLPTLAQGVQQIISGLEAVVPQQVADMAAGNPPGSGGSGMGAPQPPPQPAQPGAVPAPPVQMQ
jgi:hypothetical protein